MHFVSSIFAPLAAASDAIDWARDRFQGYRNSQQALNLKSSDQLENFSDESDRLDGLKSIADNKRDKESFVRSSENKFKVVSGPVHDKPLSLALYRKTPLTEWLDKTTNNSNANKLLQDKIGGDILIDNVNALYFAIDSYRAATASAQHEKLPEMLENLLQIITLTYERFDKNLANHPPAEDLYHRLHTDQDFVSNSVKDAISLCFETIEKGALSPVNCHRKENIRHLDLIAEKLSQFIDLTNWHAFAEFAGDMDRLHIDPLRTRLNFSLIENE